MSFVANLFTQVRPHHAAPIPRQTRASIDDDMFHIEAAGLGLGDSVAEQRRKEEAELRRREDEIRKKEEELQRVLQQLSDAGEREDHLSQSLAEAQTTSQQRIKDLSAELATVKGLHSTAEVKVA